MPPVLKVKQFGLPRYVWLIALTGGVGVGLYIRHKRAQQDTSGTAVDTTSADPSTTTPDNPADYGNADNQGLPVGFYDAVSGASLPNAAGADTTGAIDINGLISALLERPTTDTPQAVTKVIQKGKRGPAGKRGKTGPKGPKGKVVGGGGPPNRPKPKVKVHPGSGVATINKVAPKANHKKKKK